MSYTITSFTNGNITVESNGKTYSMAVPIVDGLYIVNALLEAFVAAKIAEIDAANAVVPVLPVNASTIAALVTAPTTQPVVDLTTRLKRMRNVILAKCDWRMTTDTALTPTEHTAWATYRQALRDLTLQVGFPTTVTWPVPPLAVIAAAEIVLTNTDGTPTDILIAQSNVQPRQL
jgi:hypothetical protein